MKHEQNEDVTLVTGGASGIGLALTEGLLESGHRVLVADVSEENLEALRSKAPATQLRCVHMDVSDEQGVRAVVEDSEASFGPISGLVNSAGIGRDVAFLDTDLDYLQRVLQVDLVGTFLVGREVARCMRQRRRGSIVNIASVSGIRGNAGRAAYGASKGGVITLTKVQAVELASDGIRVNAVAPGPIETPLVGRMHTEAARQRWVSDVPQRRYAAPAELNGTLAWLLDDKLSSFVTGQVVSVDGGFTAAGLL